MTWRRPEKTIASVEKDDESGEKIVTLTLENTIEDRLRIYNQMMRVKQALAEAEAGQKFRITFPGY